MAGELLERGDHLTELRQAHAAAVAGHRGVLVLLSGEAGVGKTTLVRHFCSDTQPIGRLLWGSCDPLFTPRPLGPFLDIAEDVGGELAELVAAGAKSYQIAATVARVARASRGTVVVLEDLHWADEATLDVLSLLGRRMESIPALVVATYRDDELDHGHPLRRLLGELRGATTVRRLSVRPLSRDAVAALATPHDLDADALYRATGGNPFFVSEVIAAPGAGIPATVRDAVMARAARLDASAAAVLEAVSIALPRAELWLLDALVSDAARGLDRCLGAGMLQAVPGGVGFRHELARIAVEESLRPHRRIALHHKAIQALAARPEGTTDLTRLAYHAEAAADPDAVLRFAPAAARHAASTGAHREAAAQYACALRFGAGLAGEARAALLEDLSYEYYLTDRMDASIDALQQAVDLWRSADDGLRAGAALSRLARPLWCAGRNADAEKAGQEALHLLERHPPGGALAFAYGLLAAVRMDEERYDETIAWGTRALELAECVRDTTVIVYSLNTLGTMQLMVGMPEGMTKLERSLALAEQAGLEDHVGRVFIHLGWAMTRTRAYDLAPWLDRGAKVCAELGLEAWELYLVAYRARVHLDLGRWNEAAADAAFVLRSAPSVPLLRILALTVLALVRVRRGDPEQWPLLDKALALVDGREQLQYRAPVAIACAEAAWLAGRGGEVDGITREVLATAVERRAAWVVGELAWLRRLAGIRENVRGAVEPYAAQLAGAGAAAAAQWERLGCRYDAALALIESDDESDLRRSLAEFHRLGARPAAGVVARRLRELGIRDLPRGPRAEAKDHPAGLTGREAEVLSLVERGASNAEIAARLHLSERTVHHHVSSILRKLGVSSRTQAVSAATRRGITAQT